ncbi:hypothetical protein QBC36DRAFT_324704 [Triangularia setosa]|uniref:Uncharacterized protein n=1 Tax=Triangularia setosa TaxID=2587417 RepID=A0AAN6WBD2_9PEZI|nr:hypothetical protein QBC36DRAFT_324704 [Podospora setosa]
MARFVRQVIESYRLAPETLLEYLQTVFPDWADEIHVETNKKDVYIAYIPDHLTEEEVEHIYSNLRTSRRRIPGR